MFDFVRKADVWASYEAGLDKALEKKIGFQLKLMQDLAVYARLAGRRGLTIGEIGGGDSRVLRALAGDNRCVNIEKFEGGANGPAREIKIPGVRNVHAFVGDFDPALQADTFDVLFSISVVEHVETPKLADFHADVVRLLKPGGEVWHAIDLYVSDEPTPYWAERFGIYRSWIEPGAALEPIGEIRAGDLRFSCSMATNPDNVMYDWGKIAPTLNELRKVAQNVSLLIGARRPGAGQAPRPFADG